jgi:hypothetical protein
MNRNTNWNGRKTCQHIAFWSYVRCVVTAGMRRPGSCASNDLGLA